MADLSARRELNRGAGDALSRASELALTPAIFALIGWRLDAWLGTMPLLLVVLFAFTMSYEVWKLFLRYDEQMRDQEAKVPGLARRRGVHDRGGLGGQEPQP
ncbi:MAG TPA: AtpZ/AtpI family protein [Acidimicrobiales bacterium]